MSRSKRVLCAAMICALALSGAHAEPADTAAPQPHRGGDGHCNGQRSAHCGARTVGHGGSLRYCLAHCIA